MTKKSQRWRILTSWEGKWAVIQLAILSTFYLIAYFLYGVTGMLFVDLFKKLATFTHSFLSIMFQRYL